MASVAESATARAATRRGNANTVEVWNRKLHYYLGLYLLFFVWLFAFTGLLLNHPSWSFAEFWAGRKQSAYNRPIHPPAGNDLEQARDLMRQLEIRGEIEWTTTRPDPTLFEFRVSRPGHILSVRADYRTQRAAVQKIGLNAWGVMHVLHTFTGVRMDDPTNHRDWILTTIWVLAMDAVSAGLILMVVSGMYMGLSSRRKRIPAAAALALGLMACGLFVAGLKLLA